MVGYDRQTIHGLKTGHHSPRIETLIDLGAAVGLELQWKEKK